MMWRAIIVAGWASVLGVSVFYRNPAEWLEVRGVTVADAWAGAPIDMTVDRVIHRPVHGDWFVEVQRIEDGGRIAVCSSSGHNHYKPGDTLPQPLTLDWWTWPMRCDLPAGRYVVETTWTLHVPGLAHLTVENESNEFEVTP